MSPRRTPERAPERVGRSDEIRFVPAQDARSVRKETSR